MRATRGEAVVLSPHHTRMYVYMLCLWLLSQTTGGYQYEFVCVGNFLSLECSPPNVIYVVNATYGQSSTCACCDPVPDDCQVYVDEVVPGRLGEIQDECDEKNECDYFFDAEDLFDWCDISGVDYLQVYMTCAPAGGLPTTTTTTTMATTQSTERTSGPGDKPTTEDGEEGGGGGSSNVGGIVGGVVASLVVVVLFTVIIVMVIRNNKAARLRGKPMAKRSANPTTSKPSGPDAKAEEWGPTGSRPLSAISLNGYANDAFSMKDETDSQQKSAAPKYGKAPRERIMPPDSIEKKAAPAVSNGVSASGNPQSAVQGNSSQPKVGKPPRPSSQPKSNLDKPDTAANTTSKNVTDEEKIIGQPPKSSSTKVEKDAINAKAKSGADPPQKKAEDSQYMALTKSDQDTSGTASPEKVYTALKTEGEEERNTLAVRHDKEEEKDNEYESVEMQPKS